MSDTAVFKPNQKQHFDCDCGLPAHGLVMETDEDGFLSIYIRLHCWDLSFWSRLKTAWAIIRGQDDHMLSDVILDRAQVTSFVDYVCSLMHDENTR